MNYLINAQEREKLYGLRWLDRLVYLELRFRMDFNTGLVGVYPKISYQALREATYVEPGSGIRDSGSPTLIQVRQSIDRLVNQGLLSRHSTDRQLIFELVYAERNFQAQNKVITNLSYDLIRSKNTVTPQKSLKNLVSYENPSLFTCDELDTGKPIEVITPLRSEIKNKKNNMTPKQKKIFTTIPDDFQPHPDTIAQALALGCENANTLASIMHFRSYQQSRGHQFADWDAAYLSWLLMGKRLHTIQAQQHGASHHAKQSTPQTGWTIVNNTVDTTAGHHDLSDFDWSTRAANDDCYEEPLDEI